MRTSLNACLFYGTDPLCTCVSGLDVQSAGGYFIPDVMPGTRLRVAGNGTLVFHSFLQGLPRNSINPSHPSLLLGCHGIIWLPNSGGGYVFEVFAVFSPYHKKSQLNRRPGMPFMLNSLIGH